MKFLSFISIFAFCFFWQYNFSLLFLILPLFVIFNEIYVTKFTFFQILKTHTLQNNIKFFNGKISSFFYGLFGIFLGIVLFFNLINISKLEFLIYFLFSPIIFLTLKFVFYKIFINNPLNNLKISAIFAFICSTILSYFYIRNYDFSTQNLQNFLTQNEILIFQNEYVEFLYNLFKKIENLKEFFIVKFLAFGGENFSKIVFFLIKFLSNFGGFFAFGLILNLKFSYKKTFWFNFFLVIFILIYLYFIIFVSKFLNVDIKFLKQYQNIEICGLGEVKNTEFLSLISQNNEKILINLKNKISTYIDQKFSQNSEKIVDEFLDSYYSFENDYLAGALYLKEIFKNEKEQNYIENLWLKTIQKYIKNDDFIEILNSNLSKNLSQNENCLNLNKISLNFQNKVIKNLSISSISGAIGVSGAKIASKVAIKSIAKFSTKIAVKTGTKIASGAAIGGSIGSIVPGFGTAIGGILGGVIGWVGGDILINKINEKLHREEFKKELLKDLENFKNEIKNIINQNLDIKNQKF